MAMDMKAIDTKLAANINKDDLYMDTEKLSSQVNNAVSALKKISTSADKMEKYLNNAVTKAHVTGEYKKTSIKLKKAIGKVSTNATARHRKLSEKFEADSSKYTSEVLQKRISDLEQIVARLEKNNKEEESNQNVNETTTGF